MSAVNSAVGTMFRKAPGNNDSILISEGYTPCRHNHLPEEFDNYKHFYNHAFQNPYSAFKQVYKKYNGGKEYNLIFTASSEFEMMDLLNWMQYLFS